VVGVGILVALLVLAGAAAVLGLVASWVFRPIDQAAKGRKAPMQFTLGDFLGLMFLAQLPMGALLFDYGEGGWLLVGFGWLAFGSMWLAGVRAISRAGIENPWHRAVFVGLIIPGSVCGVMGLLPLAMLAVTLPARPHRSSTEGALIVGGLAALALALFAFGLLTRRMLARRPKNAETGADDATPPNSPPDPFADDEESRLEP